MGCIAFDAATIKTGWAMWDRHVLLTGTIDKVAESADLIDVLDHAIKLGLSTVVIEGGYFGVNAATYGNLREVHGAIKRQAWIMGLCSRTVQPSVWQASYGITGGREERKVGARRVANRLGYQGKSQDEADAVVLCAYADAMERMGWE